jgi:DNA-binding CsgD family transcriptional regulator
VYTAINHRDYLYIGTNQGLYVFNEKLSQFEFVSSTRGQVWNLKTLGNELYCFHDKGLFKIKGSKASLVDAQTGYWSASEYIDSKGLSSYVIGGYNGVYIYRPNRNSIVEKVEGFTTPSRFVELLDDTIVVNHESLGVFLLDFDWNNLVIRSEKQIPALGTASSLFLLKDELYYKSSEGFFNVDKGALQYHRELTALVPEPIVRPAQNSYEPDEVSFLSKEKILRLRVTNTGDYRAIEEFLPETRLKSFGVSGFENINAIDSNEYLIGLKDGFLVIDTNLNDEEPTSFPIWLLNLEAARQDEFVSLSPEESHLLKAEESTIRISYTHPSFSERYPTTYEYQLTSERDTITDRSPSTVKTYYNLKPGSYSLSTRVIGISGEILASSQSIRFEIDKPWYQTAQFTLYLIFSGLIIFFVASAIVRIVYKRRERKIREESERLLETNQLREENRISLLKNKHLENELELRKRELTGVYEAEIRRNALLKDLKTQIGKAKSEKPVEEITALIDKQLEDDSDWTKFESAFNELDFEFIANLNKRHQGLTRQEVRLLVYIRLNLSNKEISELLNIGLKSVEMKRYRVRKKLGLEKSQNLSEYIHSF